jgi:hypothetical protein
MVDTSTFPYDCMVLIESPDPQKPGWYDQGSGVVIGPHTILTASHVVYSVSEQTSYQSFQLYLGWNAPDPKLQSGFISTTCTPHGWEIGSLGSDNLSPSDSAWDFAVIDTSYTFSSWLGVQLNDSGGLEHLTGYAGTAGGYLTDQIGTLSADPTYSIYDYGTISSEKGDSGGPIWRDLTGSGADYVTGVVSTAGHACQLTTKDWSYIESWVTQDGYSLSPAGEVEIWDMGTTNNVVSQEIVSKNPGPQWQAIGTGKFYDYLGQDILWQNSSTGQAAIWEMVGGTPINGGVLNANPGPGWKAVGSGDFNGDGLSDILWQNTSTGQAAVWEMAGTNIIGGGVVNADPGPSWKAVGTGDFNDDGKADILWQNQSTGQVAIWTMNGASQEGPGQILALNPGPDWQAIGSGDFDGRGWDGDILFQSRSTGQVAIWEMNGANIIGGGAVNAYPGSNWQAIGAADLPVPYIPGDIIVPHSGILFQDASSGQIAIWDMNGNAITGGGVVNANPGSSWHAVGVNPNDGNILFQHS